MVKGEFPSPVPVNWGVPQGTVLGPILFLCHINDQTDSSSVRLFADGCLLYSPIHSICDHLNFQKVLKSLEDWAMEWGMSFIASKCYIMRVSRSRSPSTHRYQINNTLLEVVDENPYPGVALSSNMKWTTQICKTANKTRSTLRLVFWDVTWNYPTTLKLSAYKTLVRSFS